MPGPLLQALVQGTCPHQAGLLALKTSNARVFVDGRPAMTSADTVNVAGCPFQVPVGAGTKPQPCVTAVPATAPRVLIGNSPAVLNQPGSTPCFSAEQIPQGPATIAGQTRVVTT
jgi:hypothetical protein